MFDWSSLFGDLSGYGNVGEGGWAPPEPPRPSFDSRFGAAFPNANAVPSSPIAPEALARNLAARGVPPPPVDAPSLPPIRMPDNNVGSSTWRADNDLAANAGGLGAELRGPSGPAPTDIRSDAQKASVGSTEMSAQARPSAMDQFAQTLKGVKMPAGPELQRLGTPSAPRPTTQIKGGDIIALLQALNAAPGGDSYKLPSTLGAALRR